MTPSSFRGLTWDHPRGRDALEAAGARLAGTGTTLQWDVHPLAGFESTAISDLAERYDVIVLDHPHLGEAVAGGCLLALDDVFGASELAAWAAGSVGPTQQSYVLAGRTWALPLDAATQVAVARPEVGEQLPRTWTEVVALSHRLPVALSLAGPHALLSLSSVCVALGEEPAATGDAFVSRSTGLAALSLLSDVASRQPAASRGLDPIGLLSAMSRQDDIAYCPLVYGYVNYAGALRYGDAPAAVPGGRPGSTLGGTGLALTRRCVPTSALLDHVRWLMSPQAQTRFLPVHNGQPSARAAWDDELVNAAAGEFYRRTRPTVETAWVRPRYAGWIEVQARGSEVVREVLTGRASPAAGLGEIDRLHARAVADTGAVREAALR